MAGANLLDMRNAFVLRLSGETDANERRFVGWIEEVDTGREFHFKSLEEMTTFVTACLHPSPDGARLPRHDDEERK